MNKSIVLLIFILLQFSFVMSIVVPYDFINFLFEESEIENDYLIIAEKSTQKAWLYRFISTGIEEFKEFSISTGREHGNKNIRGDLKTPEGLYFAYPFISSETLFNRYGSIASQYGTGAWDLGYPNQLDRIRRKTGSGIWIHGTDVDLTPYDTEGCIRFENEVITYFREELDLMHTPVIINEIINWVEIDFLYSELERIKLTLERWLDAWKVQDINNYLNFYCSDTFVTNNQNMSYFEWDKHKRAVFDNNNPVIIELSDYFYYYASNLLLVTFTQIYESKTVKSNGTKQLVMRKDENDWIIIQEEWTSN